MKRAVQKQCSHGVWETLEIRLLLTGSAWHYKRRRQCVFVCLCMHIYIKTNYHAALSHAVPDNSLHFNALAKKMRKLLSRGERINWHCFQLSKASGGPIICTVQFCLDKHRLLSWVALEDTVRLIPALSQGTRTIAWKNRSKARIYLGRKKTNWKEAKS